MRQRQYEDTVIYQRKIFEGYLRSAGKCISHVTSDTLLEYGEFYFSALLYAPENIREEMFSIHTLMQNRKWREASSQFEKLIPMIHAMLQKL